MTDALLLAVDGGNSKTDVVLLRPDGSVVAAVRGPGSNPDSLGMDGALDVIERLIDAAWQRTARGRDSRRPVASTGAFFLAGADQPDEVSELHATVTSRAWADRVMIGNDTLALLWAGSTSGFGVAVVVGAGVNGIGRAETGLEAHFGALGPVTGDWGGGIGIGLAALGAAVRGEEGRTAPTVLSTMTAAHFDARSALDVAVAVHRGNIDDRRLAELPPLVFAAAQRGDDEALAIVDRQADEVVAFAVAALRRTEQTRGAVEVVIGGSVLAAAPARLIDRVRDGVTAVAPRADVVLWRGAPVVGAAVAVLHLSAAAAAAHARLRAELTDDLIAPVSDGGVGESR